MYMYIYIYHIQSIVLCIMRILHTYILLSIRIPFLIMISQWIGHIMRIQWCQWHSSLFLRVVNYRLAFVLASPGLRQSCFACNKNLMGVAHPQKRLPVNVEHRSNMFKTRDSHFQVYSFQGLRSPSKTRALLFEVPGC